MNDTAPSVTEVRFETADIPTLRRALLADADVLEARASAYSYAAVGTEMAAWTGLLLAGSNHRLIAGLLGIALRDPGLTDAGRREMARLVGQVLDGWPEVLDGANDDLGDEPEPVEQAPGQPAPRGFRVGDLVEITARDDEGERTPPGARLIGRTGYVSEIDDNPEYPIGLTVEGWLGPVWCKSNELRHLDRRCTACDGTGQRHETDPVDGEFESTDVCDGCDGTGHVAIEAESGAER